MNDPSSTFPAVFSDVDETIIAGKSLFQFANELGRALPSPQSDVLAATLRDISSALQRGVSRSDLNRRFYREVLGGRSVELIDQIAARWYGDAVLAHSFFKPGVKRFITGAQRQGARLVLVSGSFPALVRPIAARFAATDLLVTPLESHQGEYTGTFEGPALIGPGKAQAVRSYAAQHQLDLARCAGIGDDPTDIAFLELLGHPHVPADAHAELLIHARAKGWPLIDA